MTARSSGSGVEPMASLLAKYGIIFWGKILKPYLSTTLSMSSRV